MLPRKELNLIIADIYFDYFTSTGKTIEDEDKLKIRYIQDERNSYNEPFLLKEVILPSKYDNYPKIHQLKLALLNAINDELYYDYKIRVESMKSIVEEDLINKHLKELGFLKSPFNS